MSGYTSKPGYYKEKIIEMLDKQINKGQRKYGLYLEENDLTFDERLDHLSEELIDGLQYIQHLKMIKEKMVEDLWFIIGGLMRLKKEENDEETEELIDEIIKRAKRIKNHFQ